MAMYRINMRFIPLGSTDRKIVAEISQQWCRDLLGEVNAIFAPAQLEFLFGSLEAVNFNDVLNLDVPPGFDPNGIETSRKALAELFPNELVVFVRRYAPANADDKRYKSFQYSSVLADYVVAEPGSTHWDLAHELGHFFGIPHTFDDGLIDTLAKTPGVEARVKLLAEKLGNAIAGGQISREDAVDLLDGDRDRFTDTPPDVGPPVFQPNDVAGEESGPLSPASVIIPVVVRKNGLATTPIPFGLRPDKLNVMSYFTFTERPHFSGQQAAAIRDIVHAGKRRRLIRGRWTNWVPRDGATLRDSPSVICRRPGLVELFGRGLDDRTWQNTYIDGHWLGWFPHDDGFELGATPAAGSMSPDHLLLVTCDPQGTVFAKWWLDSAGAWTTWAPLGDAKLKGAPSIICRKPGLAELFGQGLDDHTWQNTFVNGDWIGWFPHDEQFALGATPSVGSMTPAHLLLAARDPQGTVFAKWWLDATGTWTAWAPLGKATLKGSPSIICRRPDMVELFGHGLDDRTWQNTHVGGDWIGWFRHEDDFPVTATANPGSMSPDHLQLFVTGADHSVSQKWWYD